MLLLFSYDMIFSSTFPRQPTGLSCFRYKSTGIIPQQLCCKAQICETDKIFFVLLTLHGSSRLTVIIEIICSFSLSVIYRQIKSYLKA